MIKPNITWHHGVPPKRGVYRVRSDGPTANAGYRYWNGERWSALVNKYKYARSYARTGLGRNTPVKYPIMWGSTALP